jgi:REP element-mobilizing transposase RayT
MNNSPLYNANELHSSYQLRYGWSAWPTSTFPKPPADEIQQQLARDWEKDGIRPLEWSWSSDLVQIVFSTKPDVSPKLVAQRAKGRLEHVWRTEENQRIKFSRKVGIRSIGDTTRQTVEAYILNQVGNASFADPAFENFMERFTRRDSTIDLLQPTATNSGRYWYNLHLVLVTDGRYREVDEGRLNVITESCFQIGQKKNYGISVLSAMPDHLHVALRGAIDHSPQDIALSFMNNLAYKLGQEHIWSENYYVGTFGEYDMGAVRKAEIAERLSSSS